MKNIQRRISNIIANGPQLIRKTKAYEQTIENIKAEITLKYEEKVKNEKNAFKRIVLNLKKQIELNRAIRQLTSPSKLYLAVK